VTNGRALPDIERLSRKLERKKVSLQDLCRLYQASAQLPLIAEALSQTDGPGGPLLMELYGNLLISAHDADHLGKFESLLEASIDLDRIPEEYMISATYDPTLGELLQV
jgi:DNA mismatch repair protein MSH2